MAVPKFEKFLFPFLLQLKDKDVTSKEMRQALAEYFKLSKEDCELKTGKGRKTQLNDRVSWSLQYLRRANFVEIVKKGTYRITNRGKEFIATHSELRISPDLMQYPEFMLFYKGKATEQSETKSGLQPLKDAEELTPTEQLESAFHIINEDLAEEILQKTLGMSSDFFERLVVDLLLRMGYGDPTGNSGLVTPKTHDDGIDGIISQDKLGLDKIYIQAKRYSPENAVPKPDLQAFSGALDEKNANKGVFITTSSFTKGAREYVEKTSKQIVLIDGRQLARYMIEYNVGVSLKMEYQVKRLDSDYFEE